MKIKLAKLIIIVTVAFCSYNFTVLAETVEFNTVTEALNWTGDKAAVTKLIITGTISGNDYSESSEWSKFRILNETFPNIEEVEILTDQDIPDFDTVNYCALFYWLEYDEFEDDYLPMSSQWLKSFSAPNVKYIGEGAFAFCENLILVDFPLATTIENWGFAFCENLISISFPLVTFIGYAAFGACENLTTINFPLVTFIDGVGFTECEKLVSATFGTGFETETEIQFGMAVFGNDDHYFYGPIITPNIELILGEYVSWPVPDLNAKTWQTPYGNEMGAPYVWKSIKIEKTGIEEIIKNNTVSIFPNPTVGNATVTFEIEKSCNVKIVLCDILGIEQINVYDGFANEGFFTEIIDTEHLSKGVYFLKILIDGNYTVKKIILE